MSKPFVPPAVEKVESVVVEEIPAKIVKTNTLVGEAVPTKPTDIFKNEINNFTALLSGETDAGNLEERVLKQNNFMLTVNNIIRLKGSDLKEVLDYFLTAINSNKEAYSDNNVFAPLYTIEKRIGQTQELNRYKTFILTMIIAAANVKTRGRFLKVFDLDTKFKIFPQEVRQEMANYFYNK
jgi:hypothetical protein